MKSLLFFIKTTLKGGVLFFLPIIFLLIIFEKIVEVFSKFITPIAIKYGIDNIAGKATLGLLILIVVLLLCFIGGLLMRIKQLEKMNHTLDGMLVSFLPSYKKIKLTATEKFIKTDNTSSQEKDKKN